MSKPTTEGEYWEKQALYWQQRATDAIEARASAEAENKELRAALTTEVGPGSGSLLSILGYYISRTAHSQEHHRAYKRLLRLAAPPTEPVE